MGPRDIVSILGYVPSFKDVAVVVKSAAIVPAEPPPRRLSQTPTPETPPAQRTSPTADAVVRTRGRSVEV